MQTITLTAMPVLGGNIVTQSIGVLVGSHLGIAGGTGGEEHQGDVIAGASISRTIQMTGEQIVFSVQIMPAFLGAANQDLGGNLGALSCSYFRQFCGIAICGTQNCADTGSIVTIHKVMDLQLIGSGDGYSAQLVQSDHSGPELVVALQHQHDLVALLDTKRGEVVCILVGHILHILEGETALSLIHIQMQHSQLIGLSASDLVHDIITKVEGFSVLESDGLQAAVLILSGTDELAADQRCGSLCGGNALADFGLHGLFTGQNHSAEYAILTANGDHAVRCGGVIVNAVALAQILNVLTQLDLQTAGHNNVKFLTTVGSQMNGLILLGCIIFVANPVGLCDLVAELRCQVGNIDAVFLSGGLTGALTGNGITRQICCAAFQQFGHFYIKRQRTFMNKRERNIDHTTFVNGASFLSEVHFFSQFSDAPTHNLAHFLNSGCDLG